MKIKEITLTKGITINLKNYEFFRVDYSQKAELESGDSPVECTKILSDNIDKVLEEETKKITE